MMKVANKAQFERAFELGRYDHASDIVSGLVNFRIMMRTNGGMSL
jgi:hypothetical protein